ALEVGKDIFPVIVEECNVPFRLRRLQFIDFTVGYEKGLAKLLTSLRIDQSPVTKSSDSKTPADAGISLVDTGERRKIIGEIRKNRSLKWGAAGTFLGVVALLMTYVYLPFNTTKNQKTSDELHTIHAWKVGSPHVGDVPDPTPPFELHKEAKQMGFDLNVEAYPAKGFAAKFFDSVEKHKEPDILVI